MKLLKNTSSLDCPGQTAYFPKQTVHVHPNHSGIGWEPLDNRSFFFCFCFFCFVEGLTISRSESLREYIFLHQVMFTICFLLATLGDEKKRVQFSEALGTVMLLHFCEFEHFIENNEHLSGQLRFWFFFIDRNNSICGSFSPTIFTKCHASDLDYVH